jgi:hypothetical protein
MIGSLVLPPFLSSSPLRSLLDLHVLPWLASLDGARQGCSIAIVVVSYRELQTKDTDIDIRIYQYIYYIIRTSSGSKYFALKNTQRIKHNHARNNCAIDYLTWWMKLVLTCFGCYVFWLC